MNLSSSEINEKAQSNCGPLVMYKCTLSALVGFLGSRWFNARILFACASKFSTLFEWIKTPHEVLLSSCMQLQGEKTNYNQKHRIGCFLLLPPQRKEVLHSKKLDGGAHYNNLSNLNFCVFLLPKYQRCPILLEIRGPPRPKIYICFYA